MIPLWTLLAFAQQDPAKPGPFDVVVETRHFEDAGRHRPLRTEIWRPAALVRSPVILFSHGFAGTRLQSRFICSHLASHGYVVASTDHAGNTFLDLNVFKVTNSSKDRPHDLRVVLDKLTQELRTPKARFTVASMKSTAPPLGIHSEATPLWRWSARGSISARKGERRRQPERSRLFRLRRSAP